ncbi:hypothetical protein [Wenzhouxiangella marina]|uniref:Uncharacterized protein n=1 Tax=Wenzhouxiangella marina TaxID=1579979 RepID=A0A0K0XSM9_9GAMM|nr:hypothetical protein [Wenzhouxiangella marina]AKS40636.1 hypothetical protein WM2015_247 [Wenzhouxiangella marina]MBB6088404.1 hypothetical protein [Wenzhouxiangella marina]
MNVLACLRAMVVALTLTGSSLGLAQDSSAIDRDLALSLPQPMTVDSINVRTGEIVLDGRRYQYAEGSTGARLAGMTEESDDDGLRLSQLRPGMQVMIQTDGTEPSADHRPLVIRIWRAER